MKTKFYYLLLLILFACSGQGDINQIKVEYIKTPIIDSEFLSGYDIVKLETPIRDALISTISTMAFGQNRIFVCDRNQQKVVAFDSSGDFIGSTQNMIGRANNEYLQLMDIATDDNEKLLFIQCDNPYQILILDYDLNFVSKTNMNYYCNEIAVDDNYIYGILPISHNDVSDKQYDYLVAIERNNVNGKPKVLLRMDNVLPGVGFGKALTSGNGIFVCGRFDDAIYQIENGAIIKEFKIDFGERALPKSAQTENISPKQFYTEYGGAEGKTFGISKVCASDSLLLFSTNRATMFVLNKNSMTCKGYNGFVNSKMPLVSTFSFPTKGLENSVIYETENIYLQNYIKMYNEGKINVRLDEKLMEIAERIDDNSNPVLIIWNIK